MDRANLDSRIKQGLFLLDGAMGTQLITRGLEAGKCNDYLNIESPDTVLDVHKAYFEAGSDAVVTNTFGANKYALARHGLSEMVEEINKAGAQIARNAAGQQRYVLGDIGPSGEFLEPLGTLKAEELKEAFSQQGQGLLAGGADGFIIETMTAVDEAAVAIEAIKSVCDLPVFVSMSFDKAGEDFKTMMGVDVEEAVSKIAALGVDAIGFNCGKIGIEDYIKLAGKYICALKAVNSDIAVLAEPNAGLPQLIDDRTVYKLSAREFAQACQKIRSAGVSVIGGCCGTSPAHIEALAKTLRK